MDIIGVMNMYDYPLDSEWTVNEIIDVMALYNAVEKAYEGGISSDELLATYKKFKVIVTSKSQEKQLDKEFEKNSGYSIYQAIKKSKEESWISL